MKKPPSESDFERYSGGGGGEGHNMEKYAQENLNIHTRGLLRKKVPVVDMISWTKVVMVMVQPQCLCVQCPPCSMLEQQDSCTAREICVFA